MEGNESVDVSVVQGKQGPYRKFRSVKRKKRRGFHGDRKRRRFNSMSNEGNAGTSSSNNNTETPTGSTINFNIQSTAKSEEYVSHEKSPTNVSFTKLMNASFESDIEGPITRAKSIEAGLLMPQGMNHGNSIVDKNILEAAINDAAMCRNCWGDGLEKPLSENKRIWAYHRRPQKLSTVRMASRL